MGWIGGKAESLYSWGVRQSSKNQNYRSSFVNVHREVVISDWVETPCLTYNANQAYKLATQHHNIQLLQSAS